MLLLLGTHDIIYRRVRNTILEKAFGCKLDDFKRYNVPVKYIKNVTSINHIMAQNLPDSFELNDGEICWGNWSPDSRTLFHSKDHSKPLVVTRDYGKGKVLWLNSCDKKDYIAKSISLPEKPFMSLLINGIEWISSTSPSREKVIIAHRGASKLYKENTIKAIEKAIELSADMVEIDIRISKDNKLIVYHDDSINNYKLIEQNYSKINNVAVKLGFRIPTFVQVLKIIKGNTMLNIELKEKGYEKDVISFALQYLSCDKFIITSFNDTSIKKIKELYTNVKCGLILGKNKPKNKLRTRLSELFPFRRIRECKADFIVPHWKLIRSGFLNRAFRNNIKVFVWTVNDKKLLKKYIKDNRISGIITDDIELALSLKRVYYSSDKSSTQ